MPPIVLGEVDTTVALREVDTGYSPDGSQIEYLEFFIGTEYELGRWNEGDKATYGNHSPNL